MLKMNALVLLILFSCCNALPEAGPGIRAEGTALQLKDEIDCPCAQHNRTADSGVASALCRRSYLPVQGLTEMLQAAGSPGALCKDLASMLQQYDVPGRVSHWLPPLNTLEVRHAAVINLWETCYIAERAPLVAQKMLQYKPHEVPGRPKHLALFLIGQEGPNSELDFPRLRVYVIPKPSAVLVDAILKAINCEGRVCKFEALEWDEAGIRLGLKELQGFPDANRQMGLSDSIDTRLGPTLRHLLVDSKHEVFGSRLIRELRTATAPYDTGVSFGYGVISDMRWHCKNQRPGGKICTGAMERVRACEIPVWFLKW